MSDRLPDDQKAFYVAATEMCQAATKVLTGLVDLVKEAKEVNSINNRTKVIHADVEKIVRLVISLIKPVSLGQFTPIGERRVGTMDIEEYTIALTPPTDRKDFVKKRLKTRLLSMDQQPASVAAWYPWQAANLSPPENFDKVIDVDLDSPAAFEVPEDALLELSYSLVDNKQNETTPKVETFTGLDKWAGPGPDDFGSATQTGERQVADVPPAPPETPPTTPPTDDSVSSSTPDVPPTTPPTDDSVSSSTPDTPPTPPTPAPPADDSVSSSDSASS